MNPGLMPILASLLMAIGAVLPAQSQQQPAPQKADEFPAAVVAAARARVGLNSPNVQIVQTQAKKNAWATSLPIEGGGFWIIIHVQTFKLYDGIGTGIEKLSGAYAEALLCGALLHEMEHICRGGDPNCVNPPHSCTHLAIDIKVRGGLCDLAAAALAEFNSSSGTAREAAWDRLAGFCEEAKRLEDKWNTPEGAARAKKCCEGGDPNCPFAPDPDCPGTDIPRPTGCTFPANQVIGSTCEACNAL